MQLFGRVAVLALAGCPRTSLFPCIGKKIRGGSEVGGPRLYFTVKAHVLFCSFLKLSNKVLSKRTAFTIFFLSSRWQHGRVF